MHSDGNRKWNKKGQMKVYKLAKFREMRNRIFQLFLKLEDKEKLTCYEDLNKI